MSQPFVNPVNWSLKNIRLPRENPVEAGEHRAHAGAAEIAG
jgi:hypothetical protein